MTLAPGTRLGPYEIEQAIGAGGMGEVYSASDTRLRRRVAVKIVPDQFSGDPDRLRRFEQEARAAASLSHVNVLVVHDVGVHDRISYVVTELLEGETLRARCRRASLAADEVAHIGTQLASGLSAAHAHGIVHRDLKPENIFLAPDGLVKILDFGLAKLVDAPSIAGQTAVTTLSGPGQLLGSIGYMSPEQIRGHHVDGRSDIFAAGAILYEALSGWRAFRGESDADTLCAILERTPTPIVDLPSGVASGLVRIIMRCLEKDPAKRYPSALELRTALNAISGAAVSGPARSGEKSIAVLPFSNVSATSDQEYFSDGLAEEMINALAQLPNLRVASRSSAFRFRGQSIDIRDVGRQLNVDNILEGSVRRAGNRLRVTVQLINVADGYHLWSERYDRELSDVFAIQDEITQSVVQRLEVKLLGEPAAPARRHSDIPEAFELYLKGRYFWYQRTEAALRAAINCFTKAIEVDATYALAYAGLADSFSVMRPWGYVSTAEIGDRAERAAARALELDPFSADAHVAVALCKLWLTDDSQGAEAHFRRALALQPQSATVIVHHANSLIATGNAAEAMKAVEQAVALDPLAPFVCGLGAVTMYACRRYDRAVDLAQRALDLHPGFALGLYALGLALCQQGQFDRGIEACNRLVEITNRASVPAGMLGYAYAAAGRRSEALLLLDELNERAGRQYVDPIGVVLIHAGLRDWDRVAVALERLTNMPGSFTALRILIAPSLEVMRGDPRFDALVGGVYLGSPGPGPDFLDGPRIA